jgi:hypothetical protein
MKSIRKWRNFSFVKLSPVTGHSVRTSKRSSNAEEMVRLVEGQRRKTTDLAQFRFPRSGSSLFFFAKESAYFVSQTRWKRLSFFSNGG